MWIWYMVQNIDSRLNVFHGLKWLFTYEMELFYWLVFPECLLFVIRLVIWMFSSSGSWPGDSPLGEFQEDWDQL